MSVIGSVQPIIMKAVQQVKEVLRPEACISIPL